MEEDDNWVHTGCTTGEQSEEEEVGASGWRNGKNDDRFIHWCKRSWVS